MNTKRLCFVVFIATVLETALAAGYAQAEIQQETVRASIGADGIQRVRIVGGSHFFKPNHIIVKVNVPVEFSISKEPGIVPHTLVIKAPEAGIVIDETLDTTAKSIVFTPKAAGKFQFYCRNKLLFFKSHRDKGMEGTLEVIE